MPDQLAFDFSEEPPHALQGFDQWRTVRLKALEELAAKQGLPLAHRVRVEFENGPPLEGILSLNEETLFAPVRKDAHLHLRIGTADFHADEIFSCVRLD